jgi:hypothetical protein
MSGLLGGLVVIPLGRSWLPGCVIQLILSVLKHLADGHVDIADQRFRYLNSYLDHRLPRIEIPQVI